MLLELNNLVKTESSGRPRRTGQAMVSSRATQQCRATQHQPSDTTVLNCNMFKSQQRTDLTRMTDDSATTAPHVRWDPSPQLYVGTQTNSLMILKKIQIAF